MRPSGDLCRVDRRHQPLTSLVTLDSDKLRKTPWHRRYSGWPGSRGNSCQDFQCGFKIYLFFILEIFYIISIFLSEHQYWDLFPHRPCYRHLQTLLPCQVPCNTYWRIWNISKFRSLQVQTGRQCWGRDCAGGRHHLRSRLWGRRWERLEVHRPVLLPGQIETYFPINSDDIMLVVTHSWQLYLHEHAKRWRQWLCAGDKLEIRHPVYYPGGADNCIIVSFWMMINWSIKDAMNNGCLLPLSNLAIALWQKPIEYWAFPIACL